MIDGIIARLAATQDGVVSREQLLTAGISGDAIAWRLKSGRLHRIHPGIYLVGHATPAPGARERAALLACGEGVVLSHRTAAALWRLVPKTAADGIVHVTVAGRQCGRPAGVSVHRTRLLTPRDIRRRDGLTLTSPARTLLDLASIDTSDHELDRALNEARVLKLVRDRDLSDVLERAGRRRGTARLGALIRRNAGPGITRSEGERRFLALIRAAGLPEPERNARIHGFEVDFLWRPQKVVVEADSFAFHATPRAFERDRRRDRILGMAGVTVKRVTWWQIVEEPYATVATVAWTLARAPATEPAPAHA